MNTITIISKAPDGVETGTAMPSVTYTEREVLDFISKAQLTDKLKGQIDDGRNQVRDYFSALEWQDGQATVNRDEVNELLESIGSYRLITKYYGTFTIHGTFSDVAAESEEQAIALLEDDISVDFYGGDITVDSIETFDVEVED